jgi:hypothetical protein
MRSMDSSGERSQVLIISRRGELQQPIKQPWHKKAIEPYSSFIPKQ